MPDTTSEDKVGDATFWTAMALFVGFIAAAVIYVL